jgi:hypothetical protein
MKSCDTLPADNMEPNPKRFRECQRVQVTRDTQGAEQVVRISLERHDAALGWYAAGAMCLPLCQLPLLQQALDELSASQCADCTETEGARRIILFPLLTQGTALEAVAETAN